MSQQASRVPSINILPREYRPRALSRTESGLLVGVLLGAILLLFSWNGLAEARQQTASLQADQRRLATSLAQVQPQVQQAEALRKEIATLQSALEQRRKTQAVAVGPRLDWNALLGGVFVEPPPGIAVSSATRSPTSLSIEGRSTGGFPALELYYHQLRALPGVTQVTVVKTEDREADLLFNLVVHF